jgi:hypothetical protein
MTTPGSADQAIFDGMNGLGINNRGLSYAEVAFLYDAHLFGLGKDYAFPEGANVSYSRLDAITTLAKIFTRMHSHADGNDYDGFDALHTILKYVLAQDPHINDDEPLSVNYKPVKGVTPPDRVRPTLPFSSSHVQTGDPVPYDPPVPPWHGPWP